MGISAYYAETVCTDANWTIDIYDVNSNRVKTLSGVATNGTIEGYWNMVDLNGVTRTNAAADPEFSAIITVYDDPMSKPAPKKKQRPQDWPAHGAWVVTYQDYFKWDYSQNNAQLGSDVKFALTAGNYGGYYLYYPQPGQTNDIGQTWPIRFQDTNHLDTNVTDAKIIKDEALLVFFLTNTSSRNLYYDGHGSFDSIADIPVSLLKSLIHHRYRFVYLNGCNTANGDLDKAFGINGPKRLAGDYYHKAGIRPAAFMGYTQDVNYAEGGQVTRNGVVYDDTIPFQVPGFISNFLFYWDSRTMGYGLLSAIDGAKYELPPVGGQYREDYLAIHGYYDLHIDEVNHRDDTW